jgi:hypothetical protein
MTIHDSTNILRIDLCTLRLPSSETTQTMGWKDRCFMALGIYFAHGGFTAEKYNEAIKQLEAAGAGAPKGRSYHVGLETDGVINVFDIWDSQEDFDAFGAVLMPILGALGVELDAPMIATVHNIIKG